MNVVSAWRFRVCLVGPVAKIFIAASSGISLLHARCTLLFSVVAEASLLREVLFYFVQRPLQSSDGDRHLVAPGW